jgi:hypothetical protein
MAGVIDVSSLSQEGKTGQADPAWLPCGSMWALAGGLSKLQGLKAEVRFLLIVWCTIYSYFR